MYTNSKVLLNAYTRWVLPTLLPHGEQSCYALDPGYCCTDMAPEGPMPVEYGARTPLYVLAFPFRRDSSTHAKFFMHCRISHY